MSSKDDVGKNVSARAQAVTGAAALGRASPE